MNAEDMASLADKARATYKAQKAERNRRAALARWSKGNHGIRQFTIPLEIGIVVVPEMTEQDYTLLLNTLALWKKNIVKDSLHVPPEDVPNEPTDS